MMHQLNGESTCAQKILPLIFKPNFYVSSSFSYDRFKNSEKADETEVSEKDADTELDSAKNEEVNQNGTESIN